MRRPVRRVPARELQQIFNEGEYHERSLRNELLTSVDSERPAGPSSGQPEGTVSRMVAYFTPDLQRVALAHEYRLPDGSIGASGRPDPKRILLENEILICE